MAWYEKTYGSGGGGGASSVEDLTDVTVSSPDIGQALVLTSPTSWKNTPTGATLTIDVPVTVSFQNYDDLPSIFYDYTYLPEPEVYTSIKGVVPYSIEWTSIDPVPPKRTTGIQLKFVPQSGAFKAYIILPLTPEIYTIAST